MTIDSAAGLTSSHVLVAGATTGQDMLAWLREIAQPGRRSFGKATRARLAATTAGIAQCATLAWLAARFPPQPDVHRFPTWILLAILLTVGVLHAAASHRARDYARRGGTAISRQLRTELLAATLPDTPQSRPIGGAATAHSVLELSDDIGAYHERTGPARAAAGPCSVIVLLSVAIIHWPAAVLLALSTPILPINMRLVGLATESASERQFTAVRMLSAQLLDRFRGMHVLQTLGATERERGSVQRACMDLNRATATVLRRAFANSVVLDAVVTFSIAITAAYVGLSLLGYLHLPHVPHLNLFSGLFVLLLAPAYFAPLREFASGYHERDRAIAAGSLLAPLLAPALQKEHAESPSGSDSPKCTRGDPLYTPLRHAPTLQLTGVTLHHHDAEFALLENISVTVEPGQLTVLAAPSGAGKSSLLALIAGLSAPTSGTIWWKDGFTGERFAPELGRASWLGQDTVILAGTLCDNIRLGSSGASAAAIADAASRAGLDPLLRRLTRGLGTVVGDSGLGLSAGEARRVAFARTLLRNAGLWLLDEPSAHLDAATEKDLLEAIMQASTDRTVLIATHSPAVIDRADTHWLLDKGQLLVTGRSGELR